MNYFFLNGLLHKKLHINRAADELTAWCYPTERRATYSYVDTKKRMRPAFTMKEVGKMLGRGRLTLEYAILDGKVPTPQHTYALNENKRKRQYMWSEDDVLAAREYLSQVHRGRPRKDGLITPMQLPSERELRAMMNNQEILYVKVGNEFRPTWQAPNI